MKIQKKITLHFVRPILSSIDSHNRECATWLSKISTPLHHYPSSAHKNAFDFLDKIRNIKILLPVKSTGKFGR